MVKTYIPRSAISEYDREILDASRLVTVETAAEILAVSRSTVINRVNEGRLTPYNDNNNKKGIRFLASELKLYVRQMRLENLS